MLLFSQKLKQNREQFIEINLKKFTLFFLFFTISFWNCQEVKISKADEKLFVSVEILDKTMQNNDDKIVNILCEDVSFGHSNGWVQNFEDFKRDFASKKVIYREIKQIEILELKRFRKTASIRRIIQVSGKYKNENFEMKLALLEIWLKKKSVWKLWSRQSVEMK